MIRSFLRRLLTGPGSGRDGPTLLPAQTIVDRWNALGSTPDAAVRLSLDQVRGLRAIVDDDAGWGHLTQLLIRSGGDSWLAHDWPEGFEPMMLCAALCRLVDYECARCRVGREQEGRSCANPASAFGKVGQLLANADRKGLAAYLGELEGRLEQMLDPLAGPGPVK